MKTSTNPNYCQRVTANDGELGNQHLWDFRENERMIPTILTTSQKLSSGVDARIRNIVLINGQFTRSFFASGADAVTINAVDLNHDGKTDLVIGNFVPSFEPANMNVVFHQQSIAGDSRWHKIEALAM